MLRPKTTLPSPALLAQWYIWFSDIFIFFSLGRWGKGAGFAFLARRCSEAAAEPSAWCTWRKQSWAWSVQGFLTLPGCCERINLVLICVRRSPAVEALLPVPCVQWFHECPSHRPRGARAALFLGRSCHPALSCSRDPGHTPASLWS